MNLESLKEEIRLAINRNSVETVSDTSDGVLADYLMDCLEAYHRAIQSRQASVFLSIPDPPEAGGFRKFVRRWWT